MSKQWTLPPPNPHLHLLLLVGKELFGTLLPSSETEGGYHIHTMAAILTKSLAVYIGAVLHITLIQIFKISSADTDTTAEI